MKNLLRKLHIGGSPAGGAEIRHDLLPSSTARVSNRPGSSPTVSGPVNSASSNTVGDNSSVLDYNYLEEEYQVQLALAISASSSAPDSGNCNDPESIQIKAAKRISLGHFPSPSPASSPVDFLSHRYWSYNVVDYDEKVIDGFYDVYCIMADPNSQGRMPSLVDLQETPVSDNVGYEVVLVNRVVDPVLRELEQKSLSIALECGGSRFSPVDSGLVQRIADLVSEQMGGAVSDADEILTRWTMRSYELRTSLNNIVLPLGCLQIGLSRHRALLFKVLADCVGISCRLVKGSYYTGTDDGAVNLIKLDNEREFIIDLMGAPGALIPTESPSGISATSPDKDSEKADQHIIVHAVQTLCSALEDKDPCLPMDRQEVGFIHNSNSGDCCRQMNSNFELLPFGANESKGTDIDFQELWQSSNDQLRIDRTKLLPLRSRRSPSWSEGASMSEQMKVNDMSKYVINAANENPGFAQKLHDVMLESGVSPPLDFIDSINSAYVSKEDSIKQNNCFAKERMLNNLRKCQDSFALVPRRPPKPIVKSNSVVQKCASNDCPTGPINGLMSSLRDTVGPPSTAPSMQTVTSVSQLASIEPAICDVTNSQISSADPSVVIGHLQHADPKHNFPVAAAFAATAAVVASSLVVATSKCSDHEAVPPIAVESNIATSVLAQKIPSSTCVSCNSKGENSDSEERAGRSNDFKDHKHEPLASSHIEELILENVEECEIRWEDLQIGERIGLGSYGEVYHADWNGTEVAVKKFLDQAFSGDALDQFRSEVRIMRRLRHPNIVLFMGAVTRPPNLSILTEFLPRGSLYRLLHRSNIQLDERRRLRMALDVAKGMNYLHSSNPVIVHRDLKSPNLLVDKNWVVKVCDFGLSRLKHHTFLSSKSTAGTPEWMAPEVLRNEPANEKCDVYSFGVILWELATLRMPWSGMNPMQVVGAVGFQNRRLEIPEEVEPSVARIISECWQNDPNLRPSFGQLMVALKGLHRLVKSVP